MRQTVPNLDPKYLRTHCQQSVNHKVSTLCSAHCLLIVDVHLNVSMIYKITCCIQEESKLCNNKETVEKKINFCVWLTHVSYFSFHIFQLYNVHIQEATLNYFILKSFELRLEDKEHIYLRQCYLISPVCSLSTVWYKILYLNSGGLHRRVDVDKSCSFWAKC